MNEEERRALDEFLKVLLVAALVIARGVVAPDYSNGRKLILVMEPITEYFHLVALAEAQSVWII